MLLCHFIYVTQELRWLSISTWFPLSHLIQMGATHDRTLKMTVPADRCGTGVFLLRVLHPGQHRLCPTPLGHSWETCWWIYEIWTIFSTPATSVNVWSPTEKVLGTFWSNTCAVNVSHLDQGAGTIFKYSHPQLCLPNSSYPSSSSYPCGTSWHTGSTKMHLYTDDNYRQSKNK